MNSDRHHDKQLSDLAFQSVLVSCLEKLERGESPDRDELLEAHPNLANVLGEFHADQGNAKTRRLPFIDHLPGKSSPEQQR